MTLKSVRSGRAARGAHRSVPGSIESATVTRSLARAPSRAALATACGAERRAADAEHDERSRTRVTRIGGRFETRRRSSRAVRQVGEGERTAVRWAASSSAGRGREPGLELRQFDGCEAFAADRASRAARSGPGGPSWPRASDGADESASCAGCSCVRPRRVKATRRVGQPRADITEPKANIELCIAEVIDVDTEDNVLVVKGAVPGPNGGYVVVRRSKR